MFLYVETFLITKIDKLKYEYLWKKTYSPEISSSIFMRWSIGEQVINMNNDNNREKICRMDGEKLSIKSLSD